MPIKLIDGCEIQPLTNGIASTRAVIITKGNIAERLIYCTYKGSKVTKYKK